MATGNGQKRKIKAAFHSNGRLRLSVFKSNTNIYAQIIDDKTGSTLLAVSSMKFEEKITGTQKAAKVGKSLAEQALAKNVSQVWFDRGANKFTGRVKALADAARSSGLEF